MIYRQKKVSYVIIALTVFVLLVLLISNFISVPLRISTVSVVFPKEKWILTRGNGGQIISHLIDYSSGHTTQYDVMQFERGEYVAASLAKYSSGKKKFFAGDTLLVIQSSNVRDQLISAEKELEIAVSNLKSQASGEKEPLIHGAESRLKYTEEQIGEQKILFERNKLLLEKGLISQQEYEIQKWNIDLLGIEKNIYKSQLENLKSGIKPEEIEHLESQIGFVKARLNFLKEWESKLAVTSPISGEMVASFSPDTILTIVNRDKIILHAPVKTVDLPEIVAGNSVMVSFSNFDKNIEAEILSVDNEVKIINGQQVVFVSMIIDNDDRRLIPGMLIESFLKLKNISLFDQIIRFFHR